jgi:hypothetical protein
MHPLEPTGFADFDRMAAVFRRTRELLHFVGATDQFPDDASELIATEALPHVEDIEEGFRVSLRAGAVELAELRALVARAGVGSNESHGAAEARAALIETMHEFALSARTEIVPAPARALAALEHARLVFALLPRTPAEEVHYPAGRRTYADISAPRRPAELAERIEELERSLWAVATHHRPRLNDAAYRRTYGFFDTAARISGSQFLPA